MSEWNPESEPFRYDSEVEPGEKRHIRYEIGETRQEIEREIEIGEFDGYRAHGDAWADE